MYISDFRHTGGATGVDSIKPLEKVSKETDGPEIKNTGWLKGVHRLVRPYNLKS